MSEHSHHYHHHHHHSWQAPRRGRLTWRRDKRMIIAIIVTVVGVVGYFSTAGRPFLKESVLMVKALFTPDSYYQEMDVDVIKTNYKLADERAAVGDSLARAQHLDSLKRDIRRQTIPVYRPGRKKEAWYISSQDMQELRRGQEDNAQHD